MPVWIGGARSDGTVVDGNLKKMACLSKIGGGGPPAPPGSATAKDHHLTKMAKGVKMDLYEIMIYLYEIPKP